MRYEIEVAGKIRQVTVVRSGAAFAVTLDGRTYHVDAARLASGAAQTLSLILDNARSRDVVMAPDAAAGRLSAIVDGAAIPVTLNGRRRGRHAESGQAASGPERLAAPMPGRVVRVLVSAGQAVHARQPLVVVEAMKMENELRAARDGTVAEVLAGEGQSVDAGTLLVVIQ